METGGFAILQNFTRETTIGVGALGSTSAAYTDYTYLGFGVAPPRPWQHTPVLMPEVIADPDAAPST